MNVFAAHQHEGRAGRVGRERPLGETDYVQVVKEVLLARTSCRSWQWSPGDSLFNSGHYSGRGFASPSRNFAASPWLSAASTRGRQREVATGFFSAVMTKKQLFAEREAIGQTIRNGILLPYPGVRN